MFWQLYVYIFRSVSTKIQQQLLHFITEDFCRWVFDEFKSYSAEVNIQDFNKKLSFLQSVQSESSSHHRTCVQLQANAKLALWSVKSGVQSSDVWRENKILRICDLKHEVHFVWFLTNWTSETHKMCAWNLLHVHLQTSSLLKKTA